MKFNCAGVCKEPRREIESNLPIKVVVGKVTKKREIKSYIFFSAKLISLHLKFASETGSKTYKIYIKIISYLDE